MVIDSMRTNHVERPLGFMMQSPVFSWRVLEGAGTEVVSTRVIVSADEAMEQVLFDGGERADLNSLGFDPGLSLAPRTRYYWKVIAKSDAGERAEGCSWFETGKQLEPWQGKWITPPAGRKEHPLMRGELSLPGAVRRARAYVCGFGLYEFYINGQKVSDELLTPYNNDYHYWMQVQSFDVTDCLRPGENVLGAMLGNGWYKGRFGFAKEQKPQFGDRFAFLCEVHCELADGSTVRFATGPDWTWKPGPVLGSGIYDGETYDARLLDEDWCQGNGSGFAPVELLDSLGYDLLTDRLSVPVCVTQTLPAPKLITTPKGESVLDFGQEITGWVEFQCSAPAGETVYLQYGEILQQGCFYRDNLRTAKAEYTYYSDGKERQVRPYFTFYGFRYVKVVQAAPVNPAHFTARVIHSDLEHMGHLETGDARVNRLIENAFWSQRDNFLDTPTDCPQRDERMGWTGDAQVFSATASYNMYTPAFYRKYLYDMLTEQKNMFHGSVPHVVPLMYGEEDENNHGSCAWSDAAAVIPWTMYLFYGDTALLREQYENMTQWAEYLIREDESTGAKRLRQTGFHFADWLALDNEDKEHPDNPFGATDPYFVASAYYYYSITLTAKASRVLGETEAAERYEQVAGEIRGAFLQEYMAADGRTKPDTQTSYVMALFLGLTDDAKGSSGRLVEKIRANGYHLDTGFVGTAWLCRVLSQAGEDETAYRLLLSEEYPGWLYEVKLGATTIWERWNSVLEDGSLSSTGMNSLNHYAYGAVVEWMYRYACGINPCEEAPGFRKINITPRPNRELGWAKASYETPFGLCESGWKIQGENVHYTLRVPFGTTAAVSLPGEGSVVVDGQEVSPDGFTVPAGDYAWTRSMAN